MLLRSALVASMALLLVQAPPAQHIECTPSVRIIGPPCLGENLCFEVCGDPGCFVCVMIALQDGPSQLMGNTIPIGTPVLFYDAIIPPNGDCFDFCIPIPKIPGLASMPIHIWTMGRDPSAPTVWIGGPDRILTLCDDPPIANCLVIMDEDTLDDDMMVVQKFALKHGVTPQYLINDDIPTQGPNNWLRWSTLFPGDIAVLPVPMPTGQVADEGFFALPPSPPWSLTSFFDGTVPQNQLDEIANVMPLRNQDLAKLIGTTCVALVYDSDISMNFNPLKGNLQGDRLGLFAFTVLDVVQPGLIPESTSDNSLYDLVIRVEPPLAYAGNPALQAVIHDHPADSVTLHSAQYQSNILTVEASSSNFVSTSVMTVSVDGFTFESPMYYHAPSMRYRTSFYSPVNLVGRRISVQNDHGGARNGLVTN
jgi:hypothetical protein